MSDDLVKRLRDAANSGGYDIYGLHCELELEAADRIEQLQAALDKCVDIVETYRIPVGNSRSGELACEWTYDALKEIRDDMKDVIRAALEEKKHD